MDTKSTARALREMANGTHRGSNVGVVLRAAKYLDAIPELADALREATNMLEEVFRSAREKGIDVRAGWGDYAIEDFRALLARVQGEKVGS